MGLLEEIPSLFTETDLNKWIGLFNMFPIKCFQIILYERFQNQEKVIIHQQQHIWASQVPHGKESPPVQETQEPQVWSLGWEDPLG